MYHDTPIEHIARAYHRAVFVDLPQILGKPVRTNEVELIAFVQGWGDTMLMFTARGGVAGQAMSSAYTVVVTDHRHWLVYCAGGLAYYVPAMKNDKWRYFNEDLNGRALVDQRLAPRRYGASITPPKATP